MYTALIVLIVIIAILMCLIVLVQNSKGGGLASSFASSNQIMGVRKTTDFLSKATAWLAGILVVLCVASAWMLPKRVVMGDESVIMENAINNNVDNPETLPGFEVPVAAEEPAQEPTTAE